MEAIITFIVDHAEEIALALFMVILKLFGKSESAEKIAKKLANKRLKRKKKLQKKVVKDSAKLEKELAELEELEKGGE